MSNSLHLSSHPPTKRVAPSEVATKNGSVLRAPLLCLAWERNRLGRLLPCSLLELALTVPEGSAPSQDLSVWDFL
jgi:hypothetical protein